MSAYTKKLIDRLVGGNGKPWCHMTALESGEMMMYHPITGSDGTTAGLRVSRATHEDCRGSLAIIRQLATAAASDGPGRPSRRVRILAPIRGKGGGTRAAVVELVARCAGGWVEVRMVGEE